MLLHKLSIATISASLLFLPTASASAAQFSPGEVNQVQHFQKEYTQLNKTKYNIDNLYEVQPNLKKKFNAGKLNKNYIKDQLAYINYYRSLFGLNPITDSNLANNNAQETASVMAAINADPFINQHGLPSDTRPSFINKSIWNLAQDTSETSNLNFNVNDQSAGDVITDLLTDHYNLSGSDTGHRAWILSTRLSTTGIGAAYGTNGYRYSVQKVLNVDDLFREASQDSVAYPSVGVFPIELAKGKNIAWSLYLSNKAYNGTPKVTIRDIDTNKSYRASDVRNYSNSGYGNFKTVITYMPGKTPIVDGHEYEIKVGNIYKYRFKLFNLDPKENISNDTLNTNGNVQKGTVQQDTKLKSPFSKINAKLWATNTPVKKSDSTTKFLNSLTKGYWNKSLFNN